MPFGSVIAVVHVLSVVLPVTWTFVVPDALAVSSSPDVVELHGISSSVSASMTVSVIVYLGYPSNAP